MNAQTDEQISHIARPEEIAPDVFPRLGNLSAAWMFRFLPVPVRQPSLPEYVYVPIGARDIKTELFVTEWNIAWESGHLRQQMFNGNSRLEIPKKLRWIKKFKGTDFRFVPLVDDCRYSAYAPLYHLMPQVTLHKFGLPALKKGLWPTIADYYGYKDILPPGFEAHLSEAFAYHVWPLLCPGSPKSGFTQSEPIRILAHGLDFWLPYADVVVQQRMKQLGRVKIEDANQAKELMKLQANCPPEFVTSRPLFGGDAWSGEQDAWCATKELIEAADRSGQLRGILEAIRSNRVEEDFSKKWTYEREDFERKLYRKRNKIKIQFVELKDTIPVHGPETEVHESLLWQSLFAILSPKDRRVAICLRSGVSRVGDISKHLKYANHSPVSKALKRIREKVSTLLA